MYALKSPPCCREKRIPISFYIRELFKDYETWKKRTIFSTMGLKGLNNKQNRENETIGVLD